MLPKISECLKLTQYVRILLKMSECLTKRKDIRRTIEGCYPVIYDKNKLLIFPGELRFCGTDQDILELANNLHWVVKPRCHAIIGRHVLLRDVT